MSAQVALDTPLAQRLNDTIQPKLVEIGWSSGGVDDSALSEYIILMLVNGKTQEQIAAELAGDLLNLGPDDPGARDFSQWLFQQVESLSQEENGVTTQPQVEQASGSQDAEMGDGPDTGDVNVPTGPKSMRNGPDRGRDKRMLGHLGKAMDRSSDSVLHRVRGHGGNERINSHSRVAPTGPRSNGARGGRSAMGRGNMSGAAASAANLTPQQQMEIFSMFEQQSRIMASMFTPEQTQQIQMMSGGGMPGMGFQSQQPQGKSLFDRVQPSRGRGGRGGHVNGNRPNGHQQAPPTPTSAMDMELTPVREAPSADSTCKYNLSCTNKDCKFAHQSPAAPPGTAIDVTDICAFGAACKNRKCTARHPSPAQKIAHQVEQDCKFFPNCTNPRCPFRHPSMPLCRNGADCTTEDCKFTHVQTKCKFNPCLNPSCAFKHEEGQKRGKFDDKVWVAGEKQHVSERKFVDENDPVEELIVPGQSDAEKAQQIQTEMIA